tara:strand:+ start:404 stop:1219 length:816 start_codon:yes stop_codon:yes gene_type:complete
MTASTAWLLAAVCLVPVYVSTFDVWRWLLAVVPYDGASAIPILAAVAVAGWAVLTLHRRRQEGRGSWLALGAAVALGVLALAMIDPHYPAKRIHLVEYIALAFVLRRAAAEHLSGTGLLLATAAIAALLGVHDELLQGAHPDRRFALVDVGVNALAGCVGALIGYATDLFAGVERSASVSRSGESVAPVIAAAWMMFAVLLAVFAVSRSVGKDQFSLWMFLPMFGAGFNWLLVREDRSASGARWAVDVIVLFGLATALVPGLVDVAAFDFR